MDNITTETMGMTGLTKLKMFVRPKTLAILLLSAVGSTTLLGCSQKDDNAETVASKQAAVATQATDNQASRNNGAWGGVYMSRDELRSPSTNIVDADSLPIMSEDASLTKWQEKFEGTETVTRYEGPNAQARSGGGESTQTVLTNTNGFVTNDGEKLYHDSCAGCHMHKGEGATGAGYYPPLANNSKMESKYYIIDILINGFRGMPSFHMMMDDEQMAAVTQFVMTDLNGLSAKVSADDVAQLRHDNPPGADPSE